MQMLGNGFLPQVARSGVGGGAIASPLDIAGCVLWLDGSDASTMFVDAGVTPVATDGALVRQWNDKSGGGNHATQTVDTNRPEYLTNQRNGLSVAWFDGTKNMLLSLIRPAEDRTVFLAISPFASDQYQYILDSETGRFIIAATGDSYNTVQIFDGAWKGSAAATIGFQKLSLVLSPGGAIYRDGAQIDTLSYLPTAIGGTTRIASNYAPDGSWTQIAIGELIIYNSALSTADRQAVEAYLMTKWGIA